MNIIVKDINKEYVLQYIPPTATLEGKKEKWSQ